MIGDDGPGRRAEGPEDVEYDMLALLAGGRFADAVTALKRWPAGDPFRVMADADLRTRTLRIDVPQLQRLRRRFATTPRLAWWADALIAERLLNDLDQAGATVAEAALLDMPTDELPPAGVLYTRARLRRAFGARWFLHPATDVLEQGRRARDLAVVDFLRGGFVEEATMTRALGATAEAVVLGEDLDGNYARLLEARALLDDPRSIWPAYVDHLLVLVASTRADADGVAEARARLHRRSSAEVSLGPLSQLVEAVAVSMGPADDRAVEALDRAVRHIDRRLIRWRWNVQYFAANWLVSTDHPEAERFARLIEDVPTLSPLDEATRRLHRLRFRIRAGEAPGQAEVVEALDGLREMGWSRLAAWFSETILDELARRVDPADPAHAAGVPTGTAPAGVVVNVMCPVLEVTVDGQPVALGGTAARLLVHLVAATPAPLHVEQVADVLWPDAPLRTARQRLNGLLHRVRTGDPGLQGLVTRAGDLVALDPDRAAIDLVEHRAACARGGDRLTAALAGVRGNLCHAQFPYDEGLVEARHRLAADWSARAAALLGTDPAIARSLAPAAAALEIDLDALAGGAGSQPAPPA